MKTIICPNYLKNDYLNKLLDENDFLTNTKIIPMEALYNFNNESDNILFFKAFKMLNSIKDDLNVYKEMVKYPAFIEEMIKFAKEVILYDIDIKSLKTDSLQKQELQIILDNLVSLPFPEHNIKNVKLDENYEVLDFFATSPFVYNLKQNSKKIIPVNINNSPDKSVKYALNKREEIEAIAQDLIINGRVLKSTIVCSDINNQLPLIKQVFKRYNIPIKNYTISLLSKTVNKYLTYLNFSINQTIDNLLELISLYKASKEVSDYIIRYINEPAELLDNPLLDEILKEDLSFLLNSTDPIIDSYTLLLNKINPDEKPIVTNIREVIEDIYPLIKSDSDIEILLYQVNQIKEVNKETIEEGVTITSFTKPVFNNDYVYVIGCTSKLYPGFNSLKGIFDEKYVEDTKYPSLSLRHQIYFEQFKWIENAANKELIYSYYKSDLSGKTIEGAFELETIAKATKWDLITINNHITLSHFLSEKTAKKLFMDNEKVYGSISSLENYFSCPYKYFISSGLKIREEKTNEIKEDTIGNIIHQLMQKLVKTDNKHYYDLDINPFLDELKNDLLKEFPKEIIYINLLFNKIKQNILLNLQYLKEMEIDTSFKSIKQEYYFKEYQITKNIVLKGIIDRIDTAYDLIRVIDYKSGSKILSLDNIAKGISLQLITYLIIASDIFNKKATQALYFNFKNTLSYRKYDKDKDYEEFIKSKRLNGIFFNAGDLDDEEKENYKIPRNQPLPFEDVKEGIKLIYENIYQNLVMGNIDTKPSDETKPCEYCPYRNICRNTKDYTKLDQLFTITEGKNNEME